MTRRGCTSFQSQSGPTWNCISTTQNELKTKFSGGKIVAIVFRDSVTSHISTTRLTINENYYSKLLHNEVHQAIKKKIRGKLSKIILLHNDIRPYMANFMKATMGWKIMNHPHYKPDLALSGFHSFEPLKLHQGGQKFESDMNSNAVSWNGYTVVTKPFMLVSVTCQDNGENEVV